MTSLMSQLLQNEIAKIPHVAAPIVIATTQEGYSLEELQEATKGDSRLYLEGFQLWLDPSKVTRPSQQASERIRSLLTDNAKIIFTIVYHAKGKWEIVVWWVRNYGHEGERECEYRRWLTLPELTKLLYIFDYDSFLEQLLSDILKGYKAYT